MSFLIGLVSSILVGLLKAILQQRQDRLTVEELVEARLHLASAERMKEAYAWKVRAARAPRGAAELRVRDKSRTIELSDHDPDADTLP